MSQIHTVKDVVGTYRFYNRLFWLGIFGIVLFPFMSVVVAFIAFQVTKDSNISAPIGLSSPLWLVAGVALALLVRGARKRARRSLDLAKLAESLQLDFSKSASESMLSLLKSISFMENPTSAKGKNVLISKDKNLPHFALDYFYAYDYGAMSFEADESMVVFPGIVQQLPDMFIFPMGVADRLLSQVFGAFQQVPVPNAPEFPKYFRIGSVDPAAAQKAFSPALLEVFRQNPKLSVVIEDGTLIVFYQLQHVPPKAYTQFLSAAHQMAKALQATS